MFFNKSIFIRFSIMKSVDVSPQWDEAKAGQNTKLLSDSLITLDSRILTDYFLNRPTRNIEFECKSTLREPSAMVNHPYETLDLKFFHFFLKYYPIFSFF